ncbi:endonuclease/exonuclease/phosphatase family protein [Pelagicoccus sp. SDUM812005]|uniref:endonuclease/exonuclease/phosphatase family protein n=1 Tax=Pelagicoccus sp. SDUM812005 TaxID=3041257 RepID=UPI00280FA4D6|nr:endonuclease/exonuclease/phosphatase family protein [Pelagicoccus sp. SDUM812005]MDQ8181121.1 endonuclease/exonuclease/phosphatase family protein [Pelagicoccus sp. SDUM812005]
MRKASPQPEAPQTPGVVLIQIDGLSRFQFERALRSGRMPYTKRLLDGRASRLTSFYPGQPSCTPAVQAELHYGVRCATPAFSFYDRSTKQNVRMYDAEWAKRIGEESASQGEGLLEGGSSYANIYTGGAAKAKYCGELNTFSHWVKELSLFRWLGLAFRNPTSCLRILKLLGAEIGIGLYDAARGIITRGELAAELTFIPARLAVAIALREAIVREVSRDIKAGLPVIHANFFGYDEAAHRRGPHSRFAHWTLKGLDQCIRKISKEAKRCRDRNYEVVIFSDHGQEHSTPYHDIAQRPLSEAIQTILPDGYRVSPASEISAFMERSKSFILNSDSDPDTQSESICWVHLQAMGPVAHLYADNQLSGEARLAWAKRCCAEAHIPTALFIDDSDQIRCVTKTQVGDLSLLEEQLTSRGHEFVEDTLEDLSTLVRSKYAGDLVLLGWHSGGKPLTFADERGSHAGPGAEECRGFVLLPRNLAWDRPSMRPRDLRQIVLSQLGRSAAVPSTDAPAPAPESLRVVSYNVHGGVGIDRRVNSERMARVIEHFNADVVCFQEAYESENGPSLRKSVAKAFGPDFYYSFLPLHQKNGVQYGLALASKYKVDIIRSEAFRLPGKRFALREPRGSIWAQIAFRDALPLNVINTHFGLNSAERIAQAECLLGEKWLGSLDEDERVVICGDFNAGPRGPAYLAFASKLSDTQLTAGNGRPSASFLSWAPLRRIDHIFASPHLKVPDSGVLRSRSIRNASDHLPVYADMVIA